MSDERFRQVGWASDGVHVHLMGLVRREDWEFRYFTVPVFVREADSEPPAEPCEVWVAAVSLPRDRYRVRETADGWEVLTLDDHGAFS